MEDDLYVTHCALEGLDIAHIAIDPLNIGQNVTQPIRPSAEAVIQYTYPLTAAHQCTCDM
jgi:hypothetical protein